VSATSAYPIADLTLVDVASAVAAGEITPTDLVEAYLARIDALEARVQAWLHLDRDGALAQAATLTEEARAGRLRGPLHGVPIGVKDEFHVAGLPTYMAESDVDPRPEDATAVARLRAAGAIIMGKTHMPIGDRLPPTRNPWNLEHTAGGSSSGSGAAVGARMVPFALGEQTAGSNLRPAAYCGVEALKPTYGRIGRFGMYPFTWSHDHVGLIGLTMADIALVFSVIGGPDPRDPTSRPEPAPAEDLELETLRPPRIGVVRNVYPERTEPVMLEAIERSAERMKAAGATVDDVLLPSDFELAWMAHKIVGDAEGATFRARRQAEAPDRPTSARDLVASLIPASYYLQAQRVRGYLWTKLRGRFVEHDALLMAVAPGAAPKGIETTGDASLLIPWSGLGYPAITVNGGLSPDGLPLGLQLVAAPMADHELMRVGAWCERTLGRLPAPRV
jgi:aspartyl-tRNA(Asn)/glutamyl-tRNA(Gln) amidotransferase subunit A